jgi:hypothetical protein
VEGAKLMAETKPPTDKEKILAEMDEIQKKYVLFSNIPLTSNYWELRKQLQIIEAEERG